MGPKFQFLKKVFPTNFFTHKTCFTTFHVDRSQKIDKNFFEPIFPHFPKNFTNVCPPMGPKTQFLKKIVSDNFFIHKPCFTTFHVDRSQKMDKHFFGPIFQNFLQVIVP